MSQVAIKVKACGLFCSKLGDTVEAKPWGPVVAKARDWFVPEIGSPVVLFQKQTVQLRKKEKIEAQLYRKLGARLQQKLETHLYETLEPSCIVFYRTLRVHGFGDSLNSAIALSLCHLVRYFFV